FAQLTKLKAAGVDTLFLFSTPKPSIQSLAFVSKVAWTPTIYLNSVSNPQVYMLAAAKAGAALKNVTSVGYIKDPTDPQWANDDGMKLYKQVIANCSTCNVQDGFNIYGVAVAYTMVGVLKQAGNNLTRANVMKIASTQLNESNPFLLPGVLTFIALYLAALKAPPGSRAQVWTCVAVATCFEVFSSLVWGIYRYRFHNVPLFVPPGHGMVYLFGLLAVQAPLVQRHGRRVAYFVLAAATAWSLAGVTVLPQLTGRVDVQGLMCLPVLAVFLLRSRRWPL